MGIEIPVVFKSVYLNREFQILNCSAVLIFRNPQKTMFGPESASWGVTGLYRSVCYIGKGDDLFFYSNRDFAAQAVRLF